MEATQRATRRLAEVTESRLVALWVAVGAGDLTVARFRSLGASLITRANQAGVQLADIGLTAEITRQLHKPASPVGLRPTPIQVDPDRIIADIDRVLTEADPEPHLRRLARSEPLLTVATAVQNGMKARNAGGWTRRLSGASCPLCTGWADGVVRSTDVTMVRHNGCDCIQSPVF